MEEYIVERIRLLEDENKRLREREKELKERVEISEISYEIMEKDIEEISDIIKANLQKGECFIHINSVAFVEMAKQNETLASVIENFEIENEGK